MSTQMEIFSSIVQYVAMQREPNNNNKRKTSLGAARCLFGVPDPNETKILVEEELRKQRESFFNKFECSFEVDNIDENTECRKRKLENIENENENPSKRLMSEEKLTTEEILHRTPRRVLQPRNDLQSYITDFWSTKKTSCDDRPAKNHQKFTNSHLKQDLI